MRRSLAVTLLALATMVPSLAATDRSHAAEAGKAEAKPEAAAEVKPEAAAGVKPEAAAEAKPEAAAEAKGKAKPTIAILAYETGTTGERDLGRQIADLLTVRLSVEEAFDLVERAKLDRILEEQKLKLRGLTDHEKAVEVGKLLGARLMVMGKTFTMGKHLMFVTKVVGVETGKVKGTITKAEPTKEMSEAIFEMSEQVAELIREQGPGLLPDAEPRPDPVAAIRKALGDKPRPTVAVVIPEVHLTRVVVIDPAAETEIKRILVACGFKVVDAGQNDLADWAKRRMKNADAPWPDALRRADVVVVGEAFSEFALRTGDLVTCTGRAEINLIDRHTGDILVADRATRRAVDLSEATAGKTALQKAGHVLGVAVGRRLVGYAPPGAKGGEE
ncbi:MAG: CsgG/HfaB family protein [Phycisphaerae bacterium]